MKGCHRCEHAARIAAGDYGDAAYEDTPCAMCDVMSGVGFAVEYEDRADMDNLNKGDADTGKGEEHLPLSVMREMVVGLLKLPPELRDVVAWRFAGMPYGDIARVQGVTRSCVEKRHRQAMRLWPALQSLFPVKLAKQARRRRRRKRVATKGTLLRSESYAGQARGSLTTEGTESRRGRRFSRRGAGSAEAGNEGVNRKEAQGSQEEGRKRED